MVNIFSHIRMYARKCLWKGKTQFKQYNVQNTNKCFEKESFYTCYVHVCRGNFIERGETFNRDRRVQGILFIGDPGYKKKRVLEYNENACAG